MFDKYSSSAFSSIKIFLPNFEIIRITTYEKYPKFSFSFIQKEKRSEFKVEHKYLSDFWQ